MRGEAVDEQENDKTACPKRYGESSRNHADGSAGVRRSLSHDDTGVLWEMDTICLMFEPSEGFEPGGAPKSVLKFAPKRLKGAEAAIVFMALTALVTALLGIITPVFSRIFIDRLLTGENPEWFLPFIFALGGISLLQFVVEWIQAVYSLKINGKLSVVGSAAYIWKTEVFLRNWSPGRGLMILQKQELETFFQIY